MQFSKEDIEHLAILSRLALSEEEKAKMMDELTAILSYVGELDKLDTKNVEVAAHASGRTNVFREDLVSPCDDETKKRLFANAPALEEGQIRVKAVFE